MKYSLLIDNIEKIRDGGHICGIKKQFPKLINDVYFDSLYFGNEFCELDIPSTFEFNCALECCSAYKMEVVLVTPPVTNYGIKKISDLLKWCLSKGIHPKVVVNDIGVASMIKRDFSQSEIILGRMFDKTAREYRCEQNALKQYFGNEGMEYVLTTAVFGEEFNRIRENFNIKKISVDNMELNFSKIPTDCAIDLYWPYIYVTTGRLCLFRNAGRKNMDMFTLDDYDCNHMCRNCFAELKETSIRKKTRLLQKGNTIYARDDKMFPDKSQHGFDQIVLQVL